MLAWLAAAAAFAAAPTPLPVDAATLESLSFSKLVFRTDDGDILGVSTEELRVEILEDLRAAGYDVRGAESVLFDQDRSVQARYLLGGNVTDVECRTDLLPFACEVAVEWQLFDTAAGAVVYKAVTRGLADAEGSALGPAARKALDHSLASLLSREAFVEAVSKKEGGTADTPPTWTGDLATKRCGAAALALPKDMESVLGAVVTVRAGGRTGSGVLVSPDGFALTAAHVVEGADSVEVAMRSGLALPAAVVRVDAYQDIAIVDVAGAGFACAPLLGAPAGVGTEVYAVGAPLGQEFSVSKGVVSGLRDVGGYRFLQTDTAINPGNSGGPLLDPTGQVAAIVSFKVAAPGLEGLGFGVPAEVIADRLDLVVGDASDPDPASRKGARGGGAAAPAVVTDTEDPSRLASLTKSPGIGGSTTHKNYDPGLVYGGGLVAATGGSIVLCTVSFYLGGLTPDTVEGWRQMQAVDAAGWGLLGVGAVMVVAGGGLHVNGSF